MMRNKVKRKVEIVMGVEISKLSEKLEEICQISNETSEIPNHTLEMYEIFYTFSKTYKDCVMHLKY